MFISVHDAPISEHIVSRKLRLIIQRIKKQLVWPPSAFFSFSFNMHALEIKQMYIFTETVQ